jgi:hypothetical protein
MRANPPACVKDIRNITTGDKIPTQYYADQPYLTPTHDGGLLCVVTTGSGHEGSRGQHVLAMKTFNLGQTWQDITPVESPEGPESSWGIPFTAPSGRVFVFYVYNADDLRELPADDPPYPGGVTQRMDSHGYYVFRWSDDHGKSWSADRGIIPVREFEIDRQNPTAGKIRLFWNVGKAFSHQGVLYLPVHKVGGFGEGWFTRSEGALVRSENLLTAANPLEARWETLPKNSIGIRAPEGGGPVAEEHSFAVLSDGSFFTVFRTIDGHPACSYSRDFGASWEPSQYMRFAQGRVMKHPRAANFVWKQSDGSYLYCFHNHGGKYLREHPERRTLCYVGRNPMWLCRGWEEKGPFGRILKWSEPEIAVYDDDPLIRISYPDCVEVEGGLLFSETEKAVARIHRLPKQLVDALDAREEVRTRALRSTRPLFTWNREDGASKVPMPRLPAFVVRNHESPYGSVRTRAGFAIVAEVQIQGSEPGVLAVNQGPNGSSLRLDWTGDGCLDLRMNDGMTEVSWKSDPVPAPVGRRHHFVINVDGGSNTISFYRNGFLNDGGERRQYGWGRISPCFLNEYSGPELLLLGSGAAEITSLSIYGRILTSAEIEYLARLSGKKIRREAALRVVQAESATA